MVADPKPAARPLKPRRAIARSPIRHKTTKPRRKHTCTTRGCNRVPSAGAMCLTHAKGKADELWGALVRTGRCELLDFPHRCGGVIQACHGFSRGYLGTRYSLDNGFSGCAAMNFIAEVKPLEWDQYLRDRWGEKKYEEMRALALNFGKSGQKVDYEAVIADLRARSGQKEEGL